MRCWLLVLCLFSVPRWVETSWLPEPARWVPASANLIAYFDWSALSASGVFLGLESALIGGESQTGIENFRELTGMDPRLDVWAVAFFTATNEDSGSEWGIACYGAFDPERVIENLEAGGGMRHSEYHEIALISVPGVGAHFGSPGGEQVLAFPDSMTALFGPPEQVRAMLDTGFGFAPRASSEDGELAGALIRLTSADTLWVVGSANGNLPSRVAGLSSLPEFASFSVSARVGWLVRVRARAETTDREAASALADLVRGIAAMGALQGQNESLQALLESLEVETVDELVDVSFNVEADTVRDYLRPNK